MGVMVGSIRDSDERKANLKEEELRRAVESRVRDSRLFKGDSPQTLYVNVNPVGGVFSPSVELLRHTEDTGFGFPETVTVWSVGAAGTLVGDGRCNIGVLSRHIDAFLAEYLRHNRDWCEDRWSGKWPANAIIRAPDR